MRTHFQGPFRGPTLPVPLRFSLDGYALLHWAVPPERLKRHLPPLFQPATTIVDGRPAAWLTVSIARLVLQGLGPMPAWPTAQVQLAYRTYVLHPGGHGAYLLRLVTSEPAAAIAYRAGLGLQADARGIRYRALGHAGALDRLDATVGGGGAEAYFRLDAAVGPVEVRGFHRREAAEAFLVQVSETAYAMGGGRYGVMVAPPTRLRADAGRLASGRFGWLKDHGLLLRDEAERPDGVWLAGFPEMQFHL